MAVGLYPASLVRLSRSNAEVANGMSSAATAAGSVVCGRWPLSMTTSLDPGISRCAFSPTGSGFLDVSLANRGVKALSLEARSGHLKGTTNPFWMIAFDYSERKRLTVAPTLTSGGVSALAAAP